MKLSKSSSNAIILSHYWRRHKSGIAPIDVTRDYLVNKVKMLITIEHPFPNSGHLESIVNVYENSKLKSTYTYHTWSTGNYLPFIWQFFTTIIIMMKFINLKFDVVIAINNLLVFSVYWLKIIGRVNKLVYYTIDYLETRFENKLINNLYHLLDRLCCRFTDKTWVVVDRQIEIRRKKGIIGQNVNISVVPMAFDQSRFIQTFTLNIDPYRLVYVGTLLEKQGIQLVIDAVNILKNKFKNISLHVIGFGEYEKKLKDQVSSLKLTKYVKFYGYIGDKDEIDKLLSFSAIGIATYVPNSDNFTYYADPSKVKVYLSCGIPVLVTDVPALAATIAKTKSGILVDYSIDSVVNGISKLMSNKKTYESYKKSAITLGSTFTKELILGKAIFEL